MHFNKTIFNILAQSETETLTRVEERYLTPTLQIETQKTRKLFQNYAL